MNYSAFYFFTRDDAGKIILLKNFTQKTQFGYSENTNNIKQKLFN